MSTLKRLVGGSLFVFLLGGTSLAQQQSSPIESPRKPVVAAAPVVTVTASSQRVRFVSPGTVVHLRLEVYNEAGQKLFDTELRGNVLDWHLLDGAGGRVAAGSYACVLTIKSLSGRLSQRMGMVTLNEKAVAAHAIAQLSTAQSQTIGPVEENAAFTVRQETEALTAVTHDGTDGQLTSTAGALTFRTGDVFAGQDKEHMRITPEGRVGIGTDKPQSTLDVVGMVRTTKGVEFADGSRLNSKEGKLVTTNAAGEPQTPDVSGTGTTGRVTKWTNGAAGTLGDTLISESNGSVVVGNSGQAGTLQIFGATTQDVFAGIGPDLVNGPALNYGYAGASFGRGAGFFNVRPDAGATPPNPSLRFMTTNIERMIITNLGNVGIGTTTPRAGVRLEVNGTTLVTPGNGYEMQLGAPNGETGLTLIKPTAPSGRADIRFDGTTLKLFAGTGIVPPGNGITIGTSGGATITGTNGDGAVLTARRSGENSFVVIDSTPASQSSVLAYRKNNFNRWLMFADSSPESGGNAGSDFKLDAYNDAGGGIANYLFVKRATGNVGIGTAAPATRLAIRGGPTWTSNSWAGSLSLGNASAVGWEANTSGQRFGIGQSNGGLYFFRTTSPFGNTSAPANYDLVITDTGNITQARAKGGLVKAMAYINADGTINRCYNGMTDSSTGNCGFLSSYAGAGSGVYYVNFQFQVTDRFISVTPLEGSGVNIGSTFSFYVGVTPTNTTVQVKIFIPDVDYSDSGTQNAFMIIVY